MDSTFYHRNYFCYIPNAVPKSFCDYILQSINWDETTDSMIINDTHTKGGYDPSKRRSKTVWCPVLSPVWTMMDSYIRRINTDAGWNFRISEVGDVQIAKYVSENQGFFGPHTDTDPNPDNETFRKLTAVVLLNEPSMFSGGQFTLENTEYNFFESVGSILVFPSNLTHSVSPVVSGERITAVGWGEGPKFI